MNDSPFFDGPGGRIATRVTTDPADRVLDEQRRTAKIALYRKSGMVVAGSFADDVLTYVALPAVADGPFVRLGSYYLRLWLVALGSTRPRATITSDEIEAVIQCW